MNNPKLLFLILSMALLSVKCSQSCVLEIPGWRLVWNDEFDRGKINELEWTFDLGSGAPSYDAYGVSSPVFSPEGMPDDQFSVRWEGFVQPDFSAEYVFYIVADDGVRLWIDNQLIIDNWIPQAATELSGSITLISNEKYQIKVEYFEDSGAEALILGWECDRLDKSLVPGENLYTVNGDNGLIGTYFDNMELQPNNNTLVQNDFVLNWVTGTGWGNNEKQFYTKSENNIRISDGNLVIEAHKEDHFGSKYTSSRIKTVDSWKYGRFEIRAMLPHGIGTWSAIWGLPIDWQYGAWPASGEIDIVEHVGFEEGEVVSSVHTQNLAGNVYQTEQQAKISIPDACTAFHTYVMEWDEDSLSIFADDQLSFTFSKNEGDWKRWPFDQSFRLLMNIAIGGHWGGAQGIDDDIFPALMKIDYVRVYQKK